MLSMLPAWLVGSDGASVYGLVDFGTYILMASSLSIFTCFYNFYLKISNAIYACSNLKKNELYKKKIIILFIIFYKKL